METKKTKPAFTGGTWKIVKEHPVLKSPTLMFGKKVIAQFPDWRGSFVRLTEEETEANMKMIAQAKNNCLLLKEIESIYLDKKEKHGLQVFENILLLNVSEAIKNSI